MSRESVKCSYVYFILKYIETLLPKANIQVDSVTNEIVEYMKDH